MPEKKTIDPATLELLQIAEAEGISTAFQRAETTKPCPIGREGNCCKSCFTGPCRLVGKTTTGICGATLETVQARNFTRAVAAGTAAHSDHGRSMAMTLIAVAAGKAPGYEVKDVKKLRRVAGYLGVPVDNRPTNEIALEVGKVALGEFSKQEGELIYLKRATEKRQALWRKLGIMPRGIDREVVETMHRTTMGVDQDAENLFTQAMRCALADGWGGSMLSTDISDILFGTPVPVMGASNFGVLREDEVNVVIHGHEPTLAEMIVTVSHDPELISYAKSKGANGINVVGMCCSGNELLMRHGVPLAGNFLQSDLIITSGAVEAMVVDIQCIMQGIQAVTEHYHTKLITTSPKAKITGATHIEFDEHHAPDTAKLILRTAIDNFPKRKKPVHIPAFSEPAIVGFSHEYIAYMLGGGYRQSFRPFNDAVMQGRIRGAAGVAGCNNPNAMHDEGHVNIIKELIKNDVLVVITGCAMAAGKHGLLTPEVMEFAGPGLREICETIGIPPVLHMGSCVDNSRILTVLTQAATEGGLGEDIDDLPAIGIAPEWMSEKALAIGTYFAASGVRTIFGMESPVKGSKEITRMMTEGWAAVVGGSLEFEPDWRKIVEKSLAHIDAKRLALKLDTYDPKRYAQSATYRPADYLSDEEFRKGKYSLAAK